MHLHRLIKTNAASAPRDSVSNHSRPSRTRARRFTMSAHSVSSVLALAAHHRGHLHHRLRRRSDDEHHHHLVRHHDGGISSVLPVEQSSRIAPGTTPLLDRVNPIHLQRHNLLHKSPLHGRPVRHCSTQFTYDWNQLFELDGTSSPCGPKQTWSNHGLTWDDGDSVVKLLEFTTSVWSTTMTTAITSVPHHCRPPSSCSNWITSNTLSLQPSSLFPTTADSKLVLELDGTEFALVDATRTTGGYVWSNHGLTWTENQSVAVKLTTSDPGVSSIALTSDPNDDSRTGNDDTYAIGDDIEATLTFNQAVDVTGSPQITLLIGSSEKAASCAAATNTTTVVCSYTVAQGNDAPDGVGVKANSLALNGGTIRKESSTTFNAFLGHAEVAVNSHRTRSMASGPRSSPPATMHRGFL